MKPAGLRLVSSSLCGVVFAGAVACSGASSSDLFAPADTSQFATEPPNGSQSSGGGGASGGKSSGSNGSSGSGKSSSSSGGSTSSSSGGSTSSSGGSSTSSSSSSSSSGGSSGGSWKSPGIYCGDNGGATRWCAPGTKLCCVTEDVGGGLSQSCEPNGAAACAAGIAIKCSDKTNCAAGQVCCGLLENSGYHAVSCQASCTSTPNVQAVRFCDPDAPADECASIGKACQPSQRLPGYSVCE